MSCADMILGSVGVAKLDEVNLSDMVVSGVIFPEFTWLLALVHLSLVEPIFKGNMPFYTTY